MFKKIIFVAICVLIECFVIYKIVSNIVADSNDNSNARAVELYANAIKLSTLNINNLMSENNVDYSNIKTSTNVKCEKINVSSSGEVELRGCTVDNSKHKYIYINGKV